MIRRGVETAVDFCEKDLVWVKQCLSKPYEAIWNELNGILIMDVDTDVKNTYSSIQKTRTFHPATNDKVFLWSQISKHIEDACRKARYYELVPKKISIFLKTKDFKIVSASSALSLPSNAPEVTLSITRNLFKKVYSKDILYRTAGVILDDLTADFTPQADLFGGTTKSDKFDLIHKQIDLLEYKLGKRIVHLGSTQKALKHKTSGTDADELDRDLLFL